MITHDHLTYLLATPEQRTYSATVSPLWAKLPTAFGDEETELNVDAFYLWLKKWARALDSKQLLQWQEVVLPVIRRRVETLETGARTVTKLKLADGYFLGDVHGRLDKVNALAEAQGEPSVDDQWIFVGDLIDNKDSDNVDHLGLLTKVRDWVSQGKAQVVLGNHEFNAIGWLLNDENGNPYRKHTDKRREQHALFLQQVGENSPEHQQWIEWFQTLPLFLELGAIRAIHACWHQESIEGLRPYLNEDNSLKTEHWANAFNREHELYRLIETLLKGPETSLPEGHSFKDINGVERTKIRVAWWKSDDQVEHYRDLAVVADDQRDNIPDCPIEPQALTFNQTPELPVVVGHYTLEPTEFPDVLSSRVVCVDFKTSREDNPLVGYYFGFGYWPDEIVTNPNDFVFANAPIASRVITDGVSQWLKMALSQLPPAIEHEPFADAVSDILFMEWDPAGVYYGKPEIDEYMCGEYYGYEEEAFHLAQYGDRDLLASYLYLMETQSIGVTGCERRCGKTAEKLIATWQTLQGESDE